MDKKMIIKKSLDNNYYLCCDNPIIGDYGIDLCGYVGKIESNPKEYSRLELEMSDDEVYVESIGFISLKEMFKIVGEISPKAIQLGYIYNGMEIGLDDYYYMPVEERKYAGYLESELPLIEVMNPNDGILY